jgi:predicted Zn-dependent protease
MYTISATKKSEALVKSIPVLALVFAAAMPLAAAEAEKVPQRSETQSPAAAKGDETATSPDATKKPDPVAKRKEMEARRKESEEKFKAEQKLREDIRKSENLARQAVAEKKWPAAIEHQREAVRLQPEERRAQYILAIILLQAKQPAEAKTVLQKLTNKDDQFGANAKRLLQHIASNA